MPRELKIDWGEVAAEQKGSGKTIKDFCKEKGIHPYTFYRHRKKIENSELIEVQVVKRTIRENPIMLKYHDVSIVLQSGFCKRTLKDLFSVLGIA